MRKKEKKERRKDSHSLLVEQEKGVSLKHAANVESKAYVM
jgi:hypothetical protein